jgi:hypothetical protein
LAGPKEKMGQCPLGPAEARGRWAGWASEPKPRKREKKIKEFLFLL